MERPHHHPRLGPRGEGGPNTLEPRPFLTPDMPTWPLEDRCEWPRCMEMLRDATAQHPTEGKR